MKRKQKIAIQGGPGSFHEQAAKLYFKDDSISLWYCESFEELFKALDSGLVSHAVVAIENTVAGSLLQNYSLLRESESVITGEYYLRIKQNLLAVPGSKINNIKEVYSHHMAIQQCRDFFRNHPGIRLIESDDTAWSAKRVAEKEVRTAGAIAGVGAAKMYGLELLAEGIETHKNNYTRFLVLSNDTFSKMSQCNKASVCFSLPHERGSLACILNMLAENEMNLTKIQSLPIIGKEWEYMFYADLVFSNSEQYENALDRLRSEAGNLAVLGNYKQGEKYN